MRTQRTIRLTQADPRRNLPVETRIKRGESLFASAFRSAFIKAAGQQGTGGIEFALDGFGIADFIWITQISDHCLNRPEPLKTPAKSRPNDSARIIAFEMKIKDWRKGLSQAYRYAYFANQSILVLPPRAATLARSQLHLFRDLGIGLWSFDASSARLQKLHTPRSSRPKNQNARKRAIEILGRRLKLCEPLKEPSSFVKSL